MASQGAASEATVRAHPLPREEEILAAGRFVSSLLLCKPACPEGLPWNTFGCRPVEAGFDLGGGQESTSSRHLLEVAGKSKQAYPGGSRPSQVCRVDYAGLRFLVERTRHQSREAESSLKVIEDYFKRLGISTIFGIIYRQWIEACDLEEEYDLTVEAYHRLIDGLRQELECYQAERAWVKEKHREKRSTEAGSGPGTETVRRLLEKLQKRKEI